MAEFDPKASRAKRPLPLWVDAFLRDTQSLETDEVGAYLKILMAMWVRPDLTLPNEPKKLARAAGVSLRLWNSRIGPALAEFFDIVSEGVTQKRLQKEAAYVERHVKQQSDRKRNKNSHNDLKINNVSSTADVTSDRSAEGPTQQPNNPTITLVSNNTNAAESANSFTENAFSNQNTLDVKTVVWRDGVSFLVGLGVLEKNARMCLGKWMRDYDGKVVIDALKAAHEAKTRDPIPYVTRVLANSVSINVDSIVAKAMEGTGHA